MISQSSAGQVMPCWPSELLTFILKCYGTDKCPKTVIVPQHAQDQILQVSHLLVINKKEK